MPCVFLSRPSSVLPYSSRHAYPAQAFPQQKASWLEEISTMHDWVVCCKSQKGREEIRSFELSGKEIFLNYYAKKKTGSQKSAYKEVKMKKNRSKKSAYRRQSVRYRSWQHQNGSERGAVMQCFCTHALFVYGVTLITPVPPLLPSAAIPR